MNDSLWMNKSKDEMRIKSAEKCVVYWRETQRRAACSGISGGVVALDLRGLYLVPEADGCFWNRE